ncbi:MAG: diguanylate cyclase [Christensenellales bacterium]|jgi:diguanylate cyclase (GGDEF)-like protein
MGCSDQKILASAIGRIIQNRPIDESSVPGTCTLLFDHLLTLQGLLQELQHYALKLSKGDIDADPPSRQNHLAAELKQLQAQLRHLAWQAECVTRGDYGQRVDFMGAFSTAFNQMVEQLTIRENGLRTQQEVMTRVFDKIEPILVVDEVQRFRVLYANSMAKKRFDLVNLSPDRKSIIQKILQLPILNDEQQVEDELTGKWYSVTIARLRWGGNEAALLFHCLDITSHKERETDLEYEANTDKLTGIFNRRALEKAIADYWTICGICGRTLSLLLFDIDFFKRYNDCYGHLQGDRCLAEFAGILKSCVGRSEDVIARYGGEEFVVLLPFTDGANAVKIAEYIRKTTQNHVIDVCQGQIKNASSITVSCGVASMIPSADSDWSQLLMLADAALYRTKQEGRNKVLLSGQGSSVQSE